MRSSRIRDESYQPAQDVRAEFGLNNASEEYGNIYLKSVNVLLLADVFENFRETCVGYNELEQAHYFTSPGLSCDAALKMTVVQLDLVTDIANRYVRANGRYMFEYDEKAPTSYFKNLETFTLTTTLDRQ